jgi:hypothetical protein
MSDDPKYRNDAPGSSMPDDLNESDRAMLSAVSHRQRDTTPLSVDQERLLDGWIAGLLPSTEADRAAELTRSNKFAAEHILERRLIAAADEGLEVPSALSARILRASRPTTSGRSGLFNLRWPTFGAWQWSGLATAAIACIAVFTLVFWQELSDNGLQFSRVQLNPDRSFQIAMVTIKDANALLEEPRYRTRGKRQQSPNSDGSLTQAPPAGEVHDLEVPTTLLRHAINSASYDRQSIEHSQLMSSLREQEQSLNSQALILIDSALGDSISEKPKRSSTEVRIYNLDDPGASAIRSNIPKLPADAHAILLTLRR